MEEKKGLEQSDTAARLREYVGWNSFGWITVIFSDATWKARKSKCFGGAQHFFLKEKRPGNNLRNA